MVFAGVFNANGFSIGFRKCYGIIFSDAKTLKKLALIPKTAISAIVFVSLVSV
jgi:hypothetical protein